MRSLQVRDVVAFDPQRRLVESERLGDLVQRDAAHGEVAGATCLVQGQRLTSVPGDGIEQRLLVAALRHPQTDPPAAAPGEPLLDSGRIRRQRRD